jgi:hypothetical protein
MIKELIIDGSSKDFTFKKVNLGDAREFFVVVPLSDDPSIKPTPIAGYEAIVFNDRTINLNQTALGEMKPESSSMKTSKFTLDMKNPEPVKNEVIR